MKLFLLACVVGLLVCATLSTADESSEKPVRAMFQSCSGCRLRRMPQLRAFLKELHQDQTYGDDVTVQYKSGANPILVLYGENDKEISRTAVDNWTTDELHAVLASHGFTKKQTDASEAEAAAADVGKAEV